MPSETPFCSATNVLHVSGRLLGTSGKIITALRFLLSYCQISLMMRIVLFVAVLLSITFLPAVHAEPIVSIKLEKSVYGYCEKLFYIIKVSKVTGEPAIIHIRDDAGKGSSAIPIPIVALENPIPSLVPFEKEIFPLGKYYIDVEYSGQKTTAEFELADLGKKCIPSAMNTIVANWLSGNISAGFLIDAFDKFVDKDVIDIPFEINEGNVYSIRVPEWVKNTAHWWLQGNISNDEFADTVNYLVENNIISDESEIGNEV